MSMYCEKACFWQCTAQCTGILNFLPHKKLHYQTLFLEYTDIANQLHEAFVYSLAEIIKSIQPSRTIKIIFNLMTSSSYCELNQCFSAPIFNQINKTHLQVQFSKTYHTQRYPIVTIFFSFVSNLRFVRRKK